MGRRWPSFPATTPPGASGEDGASGTGADAGPGAGGSPSGPNDPGGGEDEAADEGEQDWRFTVAVNGDTTRHIVPEHTTRGTYPLDGRAVLIAACGWLVYDPADASNADIVVSPQWALCEDCLRCVRHPLAG